jgi:RNA-directed DNA polymerase
VICCRGTADEALAAMRDMMRRLKLTVNEQKTHVCRFPEDKFDFLGYTFERLYSPRTGNAYLGMQPSRKKVSRICEEITELTRRNTCMWDASEQVGRLNRLLAGWGNYFRIGTVHKAYRKVDYHARQRLRQWLCAKHKHPGDGYTRFPDQYLVQELGLIQLAQRRRTPVCANP